MKFTYAIYCIDTQKAPFCYDTFRFLSIALGHYIIKTRSLLHSAGCMATVAQRVRRLSYDMHGGRHTHRMTAVVYSPKRHKPSGITAQIFYIYYVLTERIAPNLR